MSNDERIVPDSDDVSDDLDIINADEESTNEKDTQD